MAEENDSNQNRRGNRPPAGALVPAGAIPMPPGPYDPYAYPPEYLMAAEEGKHLREYWLILIRRKWVALAVLAVALAVAVAYVWYKTPLYLAATQIELESQSENILPYDQILGGGASNYDEYVETQIRHITSRTLAARVVETLGLDRDDVPDPFIEQKNTGTLAGWLSMGRHYTPAAPGAAGAWSPEEKKQAAIDKLLLNLTVTPERNSRVVELSYLSRDPERAARIVNTICAEYIQYNFQAKFDATTRATDFLQKQLVDLKSKVESSDNELIDYARKHSIVSLGEKQDVITQALGDINAQLTEARALRMAKESVYRTIAQTTPDDFPQALRTPLIEKIEGALLNDEQELARLSAQLGPAMPQVKQLESRVGRAREQLRHERGLAIANARAEYETALDTENRLARAFDGQKALADQMSEAGIHYNILKREAETNKELYDGLLQRMKEAGVAAGLKSSNIRIVDRAEIPKLPHSPNIPRTLALALLLGGMGGVGLAFFLDYLDNSLKTPEDIEEQVGLPSLGLIPSLQSARGGYGRLRKGGRSEALAAQGVELAALTAGSSLIAEAYRGVRTALLLSTPGNPPKIIMVTSSKAGEGKTTTTCNIALSLAQTGKRVLVVDCDMRWPRIHKIFNTQGSSGLSEYLTGQVNLVDVVEESQVPGLFVVHAGTTPPNPGELLGSQRMQDALEGAADTFDFVFLDTPPLMSVTDPLIVAPLSDGVILVSKGGENPPEILRRARKNLEMVHARILGVVCNSVDLRATAYSHYYHQYYDYHSYVNDNPSTKAS
jgi:capsular exopolysaccharide synthesis family protein